jgi:hypothetical protein
MRLRTLSFWFDICFSFLITEKRICVRGFTQQTRREYTPDTGGSTQQSAISIQPALMLLAQHHSDRDIETDRIFTGEIALGWNLLLSASRQAVLAPKNIGLPES